jgi:hypothetical protein
MKKTGGLVGTLAAVLLIGALGRGVAVDAASGEEVKSAYRVLAPIESGNLLLFPVVRGDAKPVVRTGGKVGGTGAFLTLDEGIKSGQVEVTEAGKAQGLVRPRGGPVVLDGNGYRGDQVNTLVLINNSDRPLLLLAGEIVTGGKQDRVIAKDRIVPAGANPIDLSVFCIEPGRWTESSVKFGATARAPAGSFMVQPSVRQRAMVAKDQQQVWSAVGGAISHLSAAPMPAAPRGAVASGMAASRPMATTSYAKAMQDSAVSEKVDEAAAPLMKSQDQILAKLREEHAVGVVVAVRGEIVWADLFADTDLLARYWTKLVRSYAAESLTDGEVHAKPAVADAQRFLDAPRSGTETSEGEVGVYRYHELKVDGTDTFVLESLLAGAEFDVHVSKLKIAATERRIRPAARPGLIIH